MYTTCLRCNRSLGRNVEIPHLKIGRRIAFDATRGRLWVICERCNQWNLTPFDERWEALEECERLADNAEARIGTSDAMLVQMPSGLELLRVGGMSDLDIANWRYGRRILARQGRVLWVLLLLLLVAAALGFGALRLTGARVAGFYTTLLVGAMLYGLWIEPPHPWMRIADGNGGRRTLWPWQRQRVRLEREGGRNVPVLVVPRLRGELRLRGGPAAEVLASLLPKLNGADCAGVRLSKVLERVADAEREAGREPRRIGHRRRRKRGGEPSPPPSSPLAPWEQIATGMTSSWLTMTTPENRLALELAVTEEVERRELQARAEALSEEWHDEEEVGAISDDLLLPDEVTSKLRELKSRSYDQGP